jgi:hypothetical protein
MPKKATGKRQTPSRTQSASVFWYGLAVGALAVAFTFGVRFLLPETGLFGDDIYGGWSEALHVDDIHTKIAGQCTIERRVACEACGSSWLDVFSDCSTCLGEAEFLADYWGKKPVLIRGMISGWAARHNWRKEKLLKSYGGQNLTVDEAVVVPNQFRISAPSLSLEEAIPLLESDPSQFVFDPKQFFQQNKRVLKDFTTPSFFKEFSPKRGHAVTANKYGQLHNWHMFSMGAGSSGLPWHTHGATWIGVVFGKKQWFLLPPGKATPQQRGSRLQSALEWVEVTLPTLTGAEHLRCVQLPGEVLYLPAAWAHLTLNIGTSLAIGAQESWNFDHSSYDRLEPGAQAGDPEAQVGWAQHLTELAARGMPGNTGQGPEKLSEQATNYLQEAVASHPSEIGAMFILIELLGTTGKDKSATMLCEELEGRLKKLEDEGVHSKTLVAGHYFILMQQYQNLRDREGYNRCRERANANSAGKADEEHRWVAPWGYQFAKV